MLFTATLLLFLCTGWHTPAAAQVDLQIGELSVLDRQFMQQQRALLQDLAARNLGRSFSGQRDRDLDLLQALLDRRLVRPGQTRELQAMGVILGEHLARDLGMRWVTYEDKLGRSRALRYRDSDTFLFPMTMISRRREVDNTATVREIYDRAYAIVDRQRPQLPFSASPTRQGLTE